LQGGRRERVAWAQAETAKLLPDWTDAEKEGVAASAGAAYWLSFDPPALARHARLVRAAEAAGGPLRIEHRVDAQRSATELTIYTVDTHGLFARLAGAMALSGATIVDAKIFTLNNGMALDTFWIQDLEGKPFARADRLARLQARIELALVNKLDIAGELARQRPNYPTRDQLFAVEPRVLIDNTASNNHTVIEVNGRDRPGFLHVVTRALTGLNLQIASAHITTYGERAVDVFYVKDLFGLKVVNTGKLAEIETTVEAAIRAFDAKFQRPGRASTSTAAE
jgi:[protein-PII] uridylyltransferase